MPTATSATAVMPAPTGTRRSRAELGERAPALRGEEPDGPTDERRRRDAEPRTASARNDDHENDEQPQHANHQPSATRSEPKVRHRGQPEQDDDRRKRSGMAIGQALEPGAKGRNGEMPDERPELLPVTKHAQHVDEAEGKAKQHGQRPEPRAEERVREQPLQQQVGPGQHEGVGEVIRPEPRSFGEQQPDDQATKRCDEGERQRAVRSPERAAPGQSEPDCEGDRERGDADDPECHRVQPEEPAAAERGQVDNAEHDQEPGENRPDGRSRRCAYGNGVRRRGRHGPFVPLWRRSTRCYPATAVRTPVILYVVALVVRAALVAAYPDPGYTDAYYYVDAARSIAQGSGFNVDVVWIFPEVGGSIPADPTLPIPAFGHWMPLAALVQVPFLAVFGPEPWASAAPFVLIGALAAPLTWAIARDAGANSVVAVGAGILIAVPALSMAFMAQPDNFALFQPLVAGALWMTARGLNGSPRSFVLAGLLAGLATLSRTDGVLVLLVVVLAFAWDRTRGRGVIPASAAVGAVAAFVLVMAPWWIRQLAVFGTLSPSMASGKVMFIRSIGEWNSIATPATLEHLLGMGAGPLLGSRVGGFVAAVTIYVVLIAGLVLAPFIVVGGWVRRRSVDFGPFFTYAALLFGFSTIVSAVHVPGGTFIHSAVALAPYSYVLALEGVVVAVAWLGRGRTAWDPAPATRLAIVGTVGVVVVGALASVTVVHAGWGAGRDRLLAVRDALDEAGAPSTARVMSIDAAATRYWTGRGGVVLVNDPVETIGQVADAYDIDWLVLDRGAVAPTNPILDGDRPAWLGEPIFEDGDPVKQAVFPVEPQAAE